MLLLGGFGCLELWQTGYLHVGHRGERLLYAGQGGGESQEGAHPQRHPGRGGLVVDPEGEPGDEDDDDAGDVHGDQEVGELPGEHEVHLETAVLPGGGAHVAVILPGPAELKPARQAHVGSELDGHLVLPHVDQVGLGQPVCNNEWQPTFSETFPHKKSEQKNKTRKHPYNFPQNPKDSQLAR